MTPPRPVTSSPAGHVHYEDDPDACTEFCLVGVTRERQVVTASTGEPAPPGTAELQTGATCGLCGGQIVPDCPARPDTYVHRDTGDEDCKPATAARRNVIGAALRSYKSETEQYLLTYKSWPLTNPYDPACCDTCRREHARWETGEVSRKLLVERLDTINDALSEVLADV